MVDTVLAGITYFTATSVFRAPLSTSFKSLYFSSIDKVCKVPVNNILNKFLETNQLRDLLSKRTGLIPQTTKTV